MDTSVRYPAGVPGITVTGSSNEGKTRSVRILNGFGSGVRYGVHNSSVNNLIRGVAERVLYVSENGVLQPCRKPKANVFSRLTGLRDRLVECLTPTTVVSREDFPSLYSGRKQKIYTRALDSLNVRGIVRRDSYVSTFVKAEKVNFSSKGDPAPRVIQPRSPRYNLEIGRYLKLFEKELCHGFRRLFDYRVILKGLNADGVAAAMHDNWRQFADPIAIGLDASRFDQHVSVQALEFEHSVYNLVFRSKELRQLLSWQLSNRGFGRVGASLVSYQVQGCRMSGDINTGMGNCLIMSCIVLAYFESVGITARLSNNGDDCVVFLDRKDSHLMDGIDEWFTEFGFKLKQEPIVDVFERVEFCQAQPVLVGNSYRMVRNPWTAMSKDCVSLLGWSAVEEFNVWRDAIGGCGIELTRGVPVWESFYRAIQHTGVLKGGSTFVYDTGMGYMARGVRAAVVTAEGRASFWRAFGITPDLQIAMEQSWPGIEYDGLPPMTNFTDCQYSSNSLRWLRTNNAKQ